MLLFRVSLIVCYSISDIKSAMMLTYSKRKMIFIAAIGGEYFQDLFLIRYQGLKGICQGQGER